jgi:hypothetical protein
MIRPKRYSSYAEFEREEIRPELKIGFSIDDLEDAMFEGEVLFDEVDGDDFYEEYEGNGRY